MREAPSTIAIRGARVHNLQGLDCDLPRGGLVVVTGPSGSGKSSLAFDTLYAEGRRRYVESLNPFARQFLDQLERPEVESISGLSPAIAIEQRAPPSHPRSTVGTVTEVYDHLRVLFAALGEPHCPRCDAPVSALSAERIAARLMAAHAGRVVTLLAPVVRGRKGGFRETLAELKAQGLRRLRVDGRALRLDDGVPALPPRRSHTIDVFLDRFALKPDAGKRLLAGLETAFTLARDAVTVIAEGAGETTFSRRLACVRCDAALPELPPRAFSFNSPYGACPACAGLGVRFSVDPRRVLPDDALSLVEGAIHPWRRHGPRLLREALSEVARRHRFGLEVPVRELPRRARRVLLEGDREFEGALGYVRRRLEAWLAGQGDGDGEADDFRAYLSEERCPACLGARLRPESRAVRLGGRAIHEYARLPLSAARATLEAVPWRERERPVAERVLHDMLGRLAFLETVGLGYLSLDRTMATLSAGETHRVRLATQIGARMQGILYVLDEPSVGLHPRDGRRLLDALVAIRDRGNTVVVVEHDEATIRAADWLLDLGEGAGPLGGRLMYQGPPAGIDGSLTGRYLRGELRIPVPLRRREPRQRLVLRGAREHNLKGFDVKIPLGMLVAVTGVSGAGKSTLVMDVLYRALARRLHAAAPEPGRHAALLGAEALDKVFAVDQSPIGRSPRSNAATYTGALALIREVFSLVPLARARGYRPGRFSSNVKGGRCEACQGDGVRRIAMHFLPDAHVRCEACEGRRFSRETLEVLYGGRSIADVLELSVADAHSLFRAHPRLSRILTTLLEVGLGYLRLGQSATTLSGGEAQRVKLARELSRRDTGRTLFILDEPTTGLHFEDVRRLLAVLERLLDAGNSVIVIEHNLDVIKSADHVIDLGPEGGDGGGRVVAQGPPEALARSRRSHTGRALREALRSERRA